MDRKKATKSSMSRQEKVDYVNNWKKDNDAFLCDAFGFDDGPQFKFLMGIFISPSTSKETGSFSTGSITGGRYPHELWEIHSIFSVWDQFK
jgi:hypothetical protein